ncbi:hypothetical protein JCM10914A_33090 [Paenibacillus sp. JCM 10914]
MVIVTRLSLYVKYINSIKLIGITNKFMRKTASDSLIIDSIVTFLIGDRSSTKKRGVIHFRQENEIFS